MVTGNTIIDAIQLIIDKINNNKNFQKYNNTTNKNEWIQV